MFFDSAIYPSDDFLVEDTGTSDIQTYFSDATVFVTGGTGFLGKLLLEKLLRTCRGINRIYVLIRQKKQDDPYKRLEKLLDDCVFNKVRKPECLKKISVMTGDLTQKNLGLDQDDLETLISEVTCVFHVGATVRFNEQIRKATYINVRATWDLLDVARQMKNLTAFVHVSTAFSFCSRKVIDEVRYQSKVKAEHLVTLVDALDEDELEKITPVILGNWPNTYTFTKAIAEDLIVRKYTDLPVAMLRPSIVSSTAREPLAGWTDNFAGVTGLILGRIMGVLHVSKVYLDRPIEVVPADYVVNSAIATAWDVGSQKVPRTPSIYNYVSSTQMPLNLHKLHYPMKNVWQKIPSVKVFSYPFLLCTLNDSLFVVLNFLFHTLFGYIYDLINVALGKPTFAVKQYKKLDEMMSYLNYFAVTEWTFTNFNTQRLWKDLSPKDKQLFHFDMSTHSWEEYVTPYAIGLRVYLLKDPLDTVPEGLKRWRILKTVHYSAIALLTALAILFFYFLCCKLL